jgi:hypothetical protein
MRFVDGDIFHADAGLITIDVANAVHHQEGIAMRQGFHDLIDVRRTERLELWLHLNLPPVRRELFACRLF